MSESGRPVRLVRLFTVAILVMCVGSDAPSGTIIAHSLDAPRGPIDQERPAADTDHSAAARHVARAIRAALGDQTPTEHAERSSAADWGTIATTRVARASGTAPFKDARPTTYDILHAGQARAATYPHHAHLKPGRPGTVSSSAALPPHAAQPAGAVPSAPAATRNPLTQRIRQLYPAGWKPDDPKPSAGPSVALSLARAWISDAGPLVGLGGISPSDFIAAENVTDGSGYHHVRLQQVHDGIPVFARNVVVHVTPRGRVQAVQGDVAARSGLPTIVRSGIDAGGAVRAAQSAVRSLGRTLPSAPVPAGKPWSNGPEAREWIVLTPGGETYVQAWRVVLWDAADHRWQVWIRYDGELIRADDTTVFDGPVVGRGVDLNGVSQTLQVTQRANWFYLSDTAEEIFVRDPAPDGDVLSGLSGALFTGDFAGLPFDTEEAPVLVSSTQANRWDDPTSVSAHYNMSAVYRYYYDSFGRRGIDGAGGSMLSVVHAVDTDGSPYVNASWNGRRMTYGDGLPGVILPFAGALDVAAHEFTHGVIEHTVGLAYLSQSGAINESMADVFGTNVDRDDWRIGEDIVLAPTFASGALRDLEDPSQGLAEDEEGWQPTTMDQYVDLPETREGDNGGVHVNSGIVNHAYYLIAKSLGRNVAEELYYRILEGRYLTQEAQFVDLCWGATAAGTELFGDPSTEVDAVRSAFEAVGIACGTPTPRPAPNDPLDGEYWLVLANDELIQDVVDHGVKAAHADGIRSQADIVDLSQSQIALDFAGHPLSVSRDQAYVWFVADDHTLHRLDPASGRESVIEPDMDYFRSISLSPDGTVLAWTTIRDDDPYIQFSDLVDPPASFALRLYSPSFEGMQVFTPLYADTLDWDPSGRWLVCDMYNELSVSADFVYEWWDVGFINYERAMGGDDSILPLAEDLPVGVDIGNPAFSESIGAALLAYEVFDNGDGSHYINIIDGFAQREASVLKMPTRDEPTTDPAYPRFSPDDLRFVYQWQADDGTYQVSIADLDETRLAVTNEQGPYLEDAQRAEWWVLNPKGRRKAVPLASPSPLPTVTRRPARVPGTPTPFGPPPPTRTPRPTRTPVLSGTAWQAYLPLALTERCPPGGVYVDVIVVLDASTSMNEAVPDGRTKFAVAQEAARRFLAGLRLFGGGDKAAVMGFNNQVIPRLRQDRWLTSDRNVLMRAIDDIGALVHNESRIEVGLAAAGAELLSPRHEAGRQQAIIVLSDGKANPVPGQTAVDTADQFKESGILFYVVGVGPTMDEGVLTAIASGRERFFRADDPTALPQIFGELVRNVICGKGSFWGRR